MMLTITPAYGRDYTNAKEALAAFRKGLDFQVQPSGQYTSLRECPVGLQLIIRYKNLRCITTVEVTAEMKEALNGSPA